MTSPVEPVREDGADWYDVSHWGVEGKAWSDTARYYDRFPARAQSLLRPEVWRLSRLSAGMSTRFETDSTQVRVRYTLTSEQLARVEMPATGVSGVDLYARLNGRDHWVAVSRPASRSVDQVLTAELDPGNRMYTAYLPLYNGVGSLQIGVSPDATFRPRAPRTDKPVVFYGTSIMQGAAASRPGMSITAILGRWLDIPTVNLGFSGQGTMDASVGELMAELDASVYVVDCCPNMRADMITDRTGPLVRQLRHARPETPILLVEDRLYAGGVAKEQIRSINLTNHAALRAAYDDLQDSGVERLFYLAGDDLVGADGEGVVDGSHPSDLGLLRYCRAYRQVLEPILGTR